MTEQKELIAVLKEAINHKKSDVKEYNNRLDQNLSQKIELLENLKKDVNEITKADMNQVNEIVDSFSITQEEKDRMKKELDIIKAVLTLNQTEKTNYTLLPNQLAIMTSFIEKLEEYIEKKNLEKQSIDPEYNHIMQLTKEYKELLSQLKNPKNITLITDIDTILKLFQEVIIEEEEKQAILLSLIKYNQEVIKAKEKEIHLQDKKITPREIEAILQKYGYTYQKLEKRYQTKLCGEGNRKNIDEVLNAMQKLELSKINEEKEGLLLTSYLLGSTKENIEKITQMAQERGINITNIEKLVGAFISSSYLYDGHKIGSKEDFIKNVSLLSEHGLSIPFIAEKQKDILLIPSRRLEENLEWLECYGLHNKINETALLDDYLSALRSKNIPEMIDLWMESHPLGLEYIRNNLNTLAYNRKDSLVLLYKLHKSQEEGNASAFRLTMANGVKKLHMKKAIASNNLEYQGINDLESAKKVTGQTKLSFERKEEYEKLAKESLHHPISDEIFNNPVIISLNRFNDAKETLLYDINGIKISKLKVLRIYNTLCLNNLGNTLDAIIYAICYQTILTEEELEELKNNIKQTVEIEGEKI